MMSLVTIGKTWKNLRTIRCNILKFVGLGGKLSQFHNTAVLSNHEFRSKLKSISLQENVHPAYSQYTSEDFKKHETNRNVVFLKENIIALL